MVSVPIRIIRVDFGLSAACPDSGPSWKCRLSGWRRRPGPDSSAHKWKCRPVARAAFFLRSRQDAAWFDWRI